MSAPTKRVIAAIYTTDDPWGVIWKVVILRCAEEADSQEVANKQCRPYETALLLAEPIETHQYRVLDGALQAIPGA